MDMPAYKRVGINMKTADLIHRGTYGRALLEVIQVANCYSLYVVDNITFWLHWSKRVPQNTESLDSDRFSEQFRDILSE